MFGAPCLVEVLSGQLVDTATGIVRDVTDSTLYAQDAAGLKFYCGQVIEEAGEPVTLFIRIGADRPQTGLLAWTLSPLTAGTQLAGFADHVYADGLSYGSTLDIRADVGRNRVVTTPLGAFNATEARVMGRTPTDSEVLELVLWINPEIGTVMETRTNSVITDCDCDGGTSAQTLSTRTLILTATNVD